ncbi:outer membrane beta-barrel family protein [Sphingomonas soli]|uniref:outer membrane beta-barrel family protein n=1 Tax=Sphingomonas soli TaxID=266127 RepID=UPI0008320C2D|nr:outer membrane beta-barrel family protein [Sphingomonas soli]
MKSRFQLSASLIVLAVCVPAIAQAQDKPAPDKSNEVVVTGKTAEVRTAPDRMSFNIANDLQAQNGTVADALRAVPGVEVDLEGRVSLRGDPGVKILVDGRPSAMMNGDSRATVLQSMPANQIERVEVITNPSAAMSPEGSGGVINLVTKQARPGARSGTIRPTLASRESAGLNVNGVLSKPGLTLTGDAGYRRLHTEQGSNQQRSRFDVLSNGFIDSRQESLARNTISFANARFGADYDLDKKNRLSTELGYRDGRAEARRVDNFTSPSSAYVRRSDSRMSNSSGSGRASWRHTIGQDHELVADLEIDRMKMKREIDAVTTPSLGGGAPGYERIGNVAVRRDYEAKLDYKRPMGEGQSLNIGYQYDLSQNDFRATGLRGASWAALAPIAGLNNRFKFDQAIHAVYGTFKFDLGKFELQPGLRLEQVDYEVDTVSDGYFRAYPTLHAGYEISAKQKLRGSYSRRIQRPSAQDFYPYPLYVDPQNLRQGNSALRPETTDSFELGWQMRDGGTFYALTGFYRKSSDGVTDVVTDLGGGVFLTSRANLATSQRAGGELIANGKLSKTLSYNASATLYWNEIHPRTAGIAARRSGTSGTVRANLSWQPTPKDFFQLNATYSGRQLVAQGYRESAGVLNLGYRRKFDERFSLVLTAQNVLDTAKQVTVIRTPLIRDRIEQRGPGRLFLLSATYNFGNPGGRKQREPGFEFDSGAGAAGQ